MTHRDAIFVFALVAALLRVLAREDKPLGEALLIAIAGLATWIVLGYAAR